MGIKKYLREFTNRITISKVIRGGFVIFGICMVCVGFYNTLLQVSQRNILMRQELFHEEKYRYPSITFCYKYKHGGKDVFQNYYPYLYKKWERAGKSSKSCKAKIVCNECVELLFYIMYLG